MNIWLNPDKLQGYGLSASQVLTAVRGQNVQFAAGSVGAEPSPEGQAFTAIGLGRGPLQHRRTVRQHHPARRCRWHHGAPEGRRAGREGRLGVRLRPASGAAPPPPVSPCSWRRAPMRWASPKRCAGAWTNCRRRFPQGVTWFSPYDSSTFVKISIEEVVKTLCRGDRAGVPGDADLPAELPRDADPDAGDPGRADGHVPGHVRDRLHHQPAQPVRHGAGDRHRGGRRDRGDRERRTHHDRGRPVAEGRHDQGDAARSAARWSRSRWCWRRCSCPARSRPAAPARSTSSSRSPSRWRWCSRRSSRWASPRRCARTLLKPTDAPRQAQLDLPRLQQASTTRSAAPTSAISAARCGMRRAGCWCSPALALLCGFLFTRMPGSFLPEEDQGYALAIVQLPPGATLDRTKRCSSRCAARSRSRTATRA